MIDSSSKIDPRVGELEDMVKLAETSTATLDSISDSVARLETLGILATLVLTVAAGYLSTANGPSGLLAGAVTGTIYVFGFKEWYRRISKLRRQLKVEFEAHDRVISLIDDHYKRLRKDHMISPVAEATFDIRIKRLDRAR